MGASFGIGAALARPLARFSQRPRERRRQPQEQRGGEVWLTPLAGSRSVLPFMRVRRRRLVTISV